LVFVSSGGGKPQSKPQQVYVDGKLIGGIYRPALRLENGMLAVLRARPDLRGYPRIANAYFNYFGGKFEKKIKINIRESVFWNLSSPDVSVCEKRLFP
jgi:hypothetical protein